MNPTERLFLYAVYLEDGGVERRAAPRDEVPHVGDIVQRREAARDALADFELDAVAVA